MNMATFPISGSAIKAITQGLFDNKLSSSMA